MLVVVEPAQEMFCPLTVTPRGAALSPAPQQR